VKTETKPVVYQEKCQSLTFCSPEFLAEIKEHGDTIEFNIFEIAQKVRDYMISNATIPVETVYYEIATYALRGRKPRTVRDWVEGIAGFQDESITGWTEAGLTMSHFKSARKLYRDDFVESPSEALDACINQRKESDRPLTVSQMENLFLPVETGQEELFKFATWLRSILDRQPPAFWPESKRKEFSSWLDYGKKFMPELKSKNVHSA